MVGAFDTGHVNGLDGVIHPDYLDHQGLAHARPIRGVDGFRHVVEAVRNAYAELSVEIADLIEGEDRAAARLVWSGLRRTGEGTRRQTLDIVRVKDGRAIEHWGGHS